MKKTLCGAVALLLLATLISPLSTARAQGTAFTYQGRLNDGGAVASGNYDLKFSLFGTNTAGTIVAGPLTNVPTAVSNGLFTVTLDFGANFPGANRWLEIGVRTNGGGSFSPLSPRQPFTTTPYAITAGNLTGSLPAAQLSGTIAGGNLPASPSFSGTVTAGSISGNGANVTNVNAATLNGLTAANFWLTNGNAGANPTNGAFIGTTDNLPLEFKVSGQRVLRIEPKTKPPGNTPAAPNVILGYFGNVVSNNPFAATILGGGVASEPNVVSGNYGTVVGGSGNTAGQNALAMGHNSTASGAYSVAIGDQALASGNESIAMGFSAAATNAGAVAFGSVTIAGGAASTAMGDHSRASGQSSTAMGLNTIASGTTATAFGSGTRATNDSATSMGSSTIAGGVSSMAMGSHAKAIHDGTFVWADTSDFYEFASTSTNQFLVLATGGVGINTNNPGSAALNVNGTVVATSFIGDGSGLTGLPSGSSNGLVTLAQLPSAVVTNGASGVTLSGTFSGNGAGLTNLSAASLGGIGSSNFWQLGGNNVSAGQFLGSTNAQPVEIRVNGSRALRLEPGVSGKGAPNVIGGSPRNFVANGLMGATIGGGGITNDNSGNSYTNSVTADFGTVAGGLNNTAAGQASAVVGGFNNIASGVASTAIGEATKASSLDSTTMGYSTTASGVASTAMGDSTTASGYDSTAMGYSTTASRDNSTAMGDSTTASGYDSTAMGYSTTASGNSSVAMGAGTTASADFSVAAGFHSKATNYASVALGNYTTAGGDSSTAMGDNTTASGSVSTAMGTSTTASSYASTAMGGGTTASGFYSTAMGQNSVASRDNSTAMGNSTVASGYSSVAMGYSTTASGDNSMAMGNSTTASGDQSFAGGNRAKANHAGSFVWADSIAADFATTRSNQFLIRAQGGVSINTNNPGNAALNVNGTVVATSFIGDGSGLTGLPSGGSNGPVTLAQLPAAVVTNGASGVTLAGTFSGNGSGLTNLLATNLAGAVPDARLSTNVALLNANQTFTGVNIFSNQLIASRGIRLNDERLWLRSDNNHGLGWCGNGHPFAGASDTIDGPVLFGWNGGALGTVHDDAEQLGAEKIALVWNASGNVGIGKTNPATALDVAGTVTADQMVANQVAANGGLVVDSTSLNDGTLNPGLTFGFSSGEGIGSKRTDGGNKYGLDFYTAGNPRLSIINGGNVGIGNPSPASKLDVNGQVRAQGMLSSGDSPMGTKFAFAGSFTEGTFNNWNGTGNNADCRRLLGADDYHCGFGEAIGPGIASPVIWMYESPGNAFEVRKVGYNQQVSSGQKLFAVHSDGTTEVQVLEITGGSDLAEPFHVSDADIPKGSLMIIDEEHPGRLKLSCEPYDHRVAGIISGANGINPGLTLHQQGKLDGGKNVALSGRVYALADATDEAIKPGDLLTSSSIPGHLMKASDYSRAHGAIVGKAMSALQKGKGMVLVLVSLQ